MPVLLKPFFRGRCVEVGCDEAGRGALAGPVVAAAVVLPPRLAGAHLLQDSKSLSAKKRDEAAVLVRAQSLDHAVAAASAQEVDAINVLQASLLAMHRALDQLKTPFEHILVDGAFFNPHRVPHTCVKGGDHRYQSIAAASILAKVHRDRLMTDLAASHPLYQWEKNKGYPTAQHRAAIRNHSLSPHHRKTFAPCASSS